MAYDLSGYFDKKTVFDVLYKYVFSFKYEYAYRRTKLFPDERGQVISSKLICK